ncbi:hypothetical protein ACFU98_39880 [Streptomyces sp. NPDC057575]|uniref:hypothetical protein n=1 Tax=unclassified Streptomyces TaxID=2593676 RepID=UPI0036B5D524
MTVTHYRVLVAISLGLLTAAIAVILALVDHDPTTGAVRDASVAFAGTTTLCLLLIGALRGGRGEGCE